MKAGDAQQCGKTRPDPCFRLPAYSASEKLICVMAWRSAFGWLIVADRAGLVQTFPRGCTLEKKGHAAHAT